MVRPCHRTIEVAILLLLATISAHKSFGAVTTRPILCAAASLQDAVESILESNRQIAVLQFSGSNTLARQIIDGAPCSLFFSADRTTMDRVAAAGKIDVSSRKALLSNRLVLIRPPKSDFRIQDISDLLRKEVTRIAVPNSSVPAGHYTETYLKKMNLLDQVLPKIVRTPHVRAALALVAEGNVDAGFVYKTDTHKFTSVEVVKEIDDPGEPITYEIAIVKGTQQKESNNLYELLTNSAALKAYQREGFLLLP